jgi:hypothetical protein
LITLIGNDFNSNSELQITIRKTNMILPCPKRGLRTKQQHRYQAYSARQTVPSRAEGNNTKCVGKKRFNGSVTHGLRKEHVLRSQILFSIRNPYINGFTNHLSIHS